MHTLVHLTIDAHGGLARWRTFEFASAHLSAGGVLWPLKGQSGVLDDVDVRVALHREWASHSPFVERHWRTSFEPHRVAVETLDGQVIDERLSPRDAFAGHQLDTPWDRLHLAYFAGYAMWTYLTAPFLFALEGTGAQELEPWQENGETWRRLRVTFPARLATHASVQTFYVGPDGLLKRHDYDADVLGRSPVAHYLHDYQDVGGIQVPTRRTVLPRRPDNTPASEPEIVTIALSKVAFS